MGWRWRRCRARVPRRPPAGSAKPPAGPRTTLKKVSGTVVWCPGASGPRTTYHQMIHRYTTYRQATTPSRIQIGFRGGSVFPREIMLTVRTAPIPRGCRGRNEGRGCRGRRPGRNRSPGRPIHGRGRDRHPIRRASASDVASLTDRSRQIPLVPAWVFAAAPKATLGAETHMMHVFSQVDQQGHQRRHRY